MLNLLEKCLARLFLVFVGLVANASFATMQAPLRIYHLTADQFLQLAVEDKLVMARDLSSLKSFLSEKYKTNIQTCEQIREVITEEDFDGYKSYMLSSTNSGTGNPTCQCY